MRGGEYSSTSTLLQEISTLRARLKDIEEDTKSSVVASGVGVVDEDSPLVIMLRKDVAQLEQEKAMQEKEFLNQISSMQKDHQRRMNEMQTKLRESEFLNEVLNGKMQKSAMEAGELRGVLDRSINDDADFFKARLKEAKAEIDDLGKKVQKAVKDGEVSRNKTETEEKYMRLLEEQRESHMKEIEQMKENLASADMEITDCRGEIDALQEEVFELQQYREALLEEVTSVRVDYSDEKRNSHQLKSEISSQKLIIEKMKHEVKEKDMRLDQKFEEITRLKKNSTASADVKKLNQDIDAKNETITRLEKELDDKKETINDLQNHKLSLLSEVTDLKMELQQAAEVAKAQLTVDTAVCASAEPHETPITPAEKRQLLEDVQTLEDRLVRFHSKLADKDCKIEGLQESLADERHSNKTLKAEIRQLRSEIGNSSSCHAQREVPFSSDSTSELLRLRDENKQLAKEVTVLRKNNDTKSHDSGSQNVAPPPPLTFTTTSKRGFHSPRTPVSGLVSQWERGFNNRKGVPSDPTSSPTLSSNDSSGDFPSAPMKSISLAEVSTLQEKLEQEKLLIQQLQKEIQKDKESISSLQDQLQTQKKIASKLQTKIDRCGSPTTLTKELHESRLQIERLEDTLRDAGKVQSRRDKALAISSAEKEAWEQNVSNLETEIENLQSELKETKYKLATKEKNLSVDAEELASLRSLVSKKEKTLAKMRSEAIEAAEQKEEFNQKTAMYQDTIEKLSLELEETKNRFASHREKLEVDSEDVTLLRLQVSEKEKALAQQQAKHSEYKEASDEELKKLRNQVSKLQSELENATTLLDDLNRRIRNETASRVAAAEKLKAEYDAGIERMELELTLTKARNAEFESEHEAKAKELQEKVNNLERDNRDLSMEVPIDAQKNFDEEVDQLTEELMNCQMKMADMEMEYSLKIKDLEGNLKSKRIELEEMQKEIDSLQNALQVAEANVEENADLEANFHKAFDIEIHRLSVQLTQVQMEKADGERVHMERLKELEGEIEGLEAEAEKEIEAKQKEIEKLQLELQDKEAQISNFASERTQLCSNINDVSFSRKEEIQELQDELLDLTTKAKTQAREIDSLKLKIHEFETRKENISAAAQKRIAELEETVREKGHMDRDAVIELKAENMQLRETIREVKLERRSLKERLEALTQNKSSSKSAQVLRERNNVLKLEVDKLTKRLKKMEESITRFAI